RPKHTALCQPILSCAGHPLSVSSRKTQITTPSVCCEQNIYVNLSYNSLALLSQFMKYLLITSIFPPINGGSAVVYEKIAEYCADHALIVLAPKRHCATNEWLEGWQQYDSTAPFQVVRTTLLRPLVVVSKSRLQSLYLFL